MKNWKNHPKKLLRIGPDPFFPRSSPGHSPQPKIDFPYQEISGPDICSLICAQRSDRKASNFIVDFDVEKREDFGVIWSESINFDHLRS